MEFGGSRERKGASVGERGERVLRSAEESGSC